MSRVADEVQQQHPPRMYPCKWVVDENGRSVPIVLQGANGPCALLALLNVQFQRGALTLAPNTPRIPEATAMSMLADLASRGAQSLAGQPEVQAQRESAVHHFVDLLPSLSQGMHVNVRFSSPTAFEFTKEIAAFDCFPDIQLVHGWLVDPQDTALTEAFGNMSYNQVMDEMVKLNSMAERIDGSSSSSPSDTVPSAPPPPEEAMLTAPARSPSSTEYGIIDIALPPHLQTPEAEPEQEVPLPQVEQLSLEPETPSPIAEHAARVWEFFDSFPTMLTYYGIAELNALLKDGETTILFRNSHFYVLRKHNGDLYTLTTDVGYEKETDIAWEMLRDVNGDSDFFSAKFTPSVLNQNRPPPPPPATSSGAGASGRGGRAGSPVTPEQRPQQGLPGAGPARPCGRRDMRNAQRRGSRASGNPPTTGYSGRPSTRRSDKRSDDACCIQ